MNTCTVCHKEFESKRSDAKTCSPKCRVKMNREGNSNQKLIHAAHDAVRRAIKTNKLIPEPCEVCGSLTTEAHHYKGYDKENWLTVKWLCKKHHKLTHNRDGVTDVSGMKVTDNTLSKVNELLAKKGLPPVVKASELPKTEWVSSGIKEIDELTKGFPRQRITEIFGMKGVGKTQLLAKITGNNKNKLKIFYVDAENSLRQDQLEGSSNIEFFQGFILEDVAEAVESALQTNEYDLIVIDSVASLVPRNESEANVGEWQMGLKARLMNQWMRKINVQLWKSKTAVVFVNQQRDTFNSWGVVRFTPGGHALPYAASLRIELKSSKAGKQEKYQLVTAIVEKSRFDRPYKTAEFKLYYE